MGMVQGRMYAVKLSNNVNGLIVIVQLPMPYNANMPSNTAATRRPGAAAMNNGVEPASSRPTNGADARRAANGGGAAGGANAKQWAPLPEHLYDKRSKRRYATGDMLGEGGFARVYLATDENKTRLAVKVVPKTTLRNQKTKNKLLSEIKIHQSMSHAHVVRFLSCFEDTTNVYMILELCEQKSLMDMLKRRRRLTEAETRFFFRQIVEATRYMHSQHVIHRDLKLGNVFMTSDMNVKIGDFGLAAMLADDDERKKTICGTPNYIAPEILFDADNGHSYEVDVWSLGVILYTMLFGKPPFQTKDVKEIYKKIREISYQFPTDIVVCDEAKELISLLLSKNPLARPTLDEVLRHQFIRNGPVPLRVPLSALYTAPSFTDDQLEPIVVEEPRKPLVAINPGQSLEDYYDDGEPIDDKRAAIAAAAAALNGVPRADRRMMDNPAYLNKTNNMVNGQQQDSQAIVTVAGAGKQTAPTTYQYGPQTLAGRDSVEVLETMFKVLESCFSRLKQGRAISSALKLEGAPKAPLVFVCKWMDYTNKYGIGYELTDGSIGVFFNDATSMVRAPDGHHLEYFSYASSNDKKLLTRDAYTVDQYASELRKKVKLVGHFHEFMNEHLYLPQDYTFVDVNRTSRLDCMSKYVRTRYGVLFRLSNRIVQINFFDHVKLVLSEDARIVTLIDQQRQLHTYSLFEALSDPESLAYTKVKHARDILRHVIAPTSSGSRTPA
ncbi:kinase-like domain-containing protein [Syncephalis fuscata]|nr:kinase-like domain-containing protein [Syncephalis fuscata]